MPFLEKLLAEDAELQDGRLVVEEVKSEIKEAGEEPTDDKTLRPSSPW